MKILYLCLDRGIPVLETKGAAVHVRSMVAALQRAGHEVTLVAQRLTSGDGTGAEVDVRVRAVAVDDTIRTAVARLREVDAFVQGSTGIVNEVRRLLYNGTVVETLLPELERDPPDAIYERLSLLGTAGAELARRLHVPHLVEANAPLAVESAAYRRLQLADLARRVERQVLVGATAVLAVSRSVRDHAIALGADPGRVHVVPNGIDADLFVPRAHDPHARRSLGAQPGEVLLGFVGGLRPWHGVEVLPDLLARLITKGAPVRLVIAGDGPLSKTLRDAFTARGLAAHVRFTGSIAHDEIAALVSQLDIALAPYPPLDHAFYFSPLKLFEYMGAGTAVVAARIGQIEEVVQDGVTGLLYPPGDFDALEACCRRAIDDAELRLAMGRAAAEHVHASYTWDHNARRVAGLAATAGGETDAA